MENWVKVYEVNIETIEEGTEGFLGLLDEGKIPHKEEIVERWRGSRVPKYEQYKIVYVPQEYKEKVESYLKEYENPNSIVYEEAEELKNFSDEDEEQLKEIKKGRIAQKMLAWIPIGMILIVIVCMIITSIIY